MMSHETRGHSNQEWYTPKHVFGALGVAFDLDVAAPVGGVPWIPAKKSFSIADNGLMQERHGNVWMNPPFGNAKFVGEWIQRFIDHRNGICLLPSRTDAKWFQRLIQHADAVCFVAGRLAFVALDGRSKGGNTIGSLLFAFGDKNVDALIQSKLGCTVDKRLPPKGRTKNAK